MAIERTTHDYIEFGDGITISVSSKAPGLTPAHAKVVDAIIEAVGKIEGSGKPTYDAIADAGRVPCSEVTEADPKLGEPAGNPPAPMDESKPKLMISIAKTMGQGTTKRGLKVISIIFENLYEVFDRDEERAMAFVGCIGSTAFKGAEAPPWTTAGRWSCLSRTTLVWTATASSSSVRSSPFSGLPLWLLLIVRSPFADNR